VVLLAQRFFFAMTVTFCWIWICIERRFLSGSHTSGTRRASGIPFRFSLTSMTFSRIMLPSDRRYIHAKETGRVFGDGQMASGHFILSWRRIGRPMLLTSSGSTGHFTTIQSFMDHRTRPSQSRQPTPGVRLGFISASVVRRGCARHRAMKTLFTILASIAIHQCALAGFETDIPVTNRVILKSKSWTPTADQAQKALASIQSFLSKPATTNEYQLREIKKILANSRNSRVQFVGKIRDGRKIILQLLPCSGQGQG
jgi:hypothetical protein